MIDTYDVQDTLDYLQDLVTRKEVDTDEVSRVFGVVRSELRDLECDERHCDNGDCDPANGYVPDIVRTHLARLRLGVYSEELHGSLREILEEIERALYE